MPEYEKRRQAPRIVIPGRLEARAQATLSVRLLDLSTGGARIEHLNLLRPGSPCRLELPPALGAPTVSAQVVWSRVLGAEPSPDGERRIRYQSGLTFVRVTAEQHAALTRLLEQFTPGGSQESRQKP
jgi:hypothetical protein